MVVEAVGYTCPSMSNLKCKPSSNGRNKRKRVCTGIFLSFFSIDLIIVYFNADNSIRNYNIFVIYSFIIFFIVLLHGTDPNGRQGVTYLPRNYGKPFFIENFSERVLNSRSDESGLYCFAQFDTISTMTQE